MRAFLGGRLFLRAPLSLCERFTEGESGVEKFIARQPIFDSHRAVYGYELLFRSGVGNFFPGIPVDVACASTTDNLFLFGIERLTRGHRAFVNCSRDFLVRDYAALLPKDRVIIEILENTEPDPEVVAACRRCCAAL